MENLYMFLVAVTVESPDDSTPSDRYIHGVLAAALEPEFLTEDFAEDGTPLKAKETEIVADPGNPGQCIKDSLRCTLQFIELQLRAIRRQIKRSQRIAELIRPGLEDMEKGYQFIRGVFSTLEDLGSICDTPCENAKGFRLEKMPLNEALDQLLGTIAAKNSKPPKNSN